MPAFQKISQSNASRVDRSIATRKAAMDSFRQLHIDRLLRNSLKRALAMPAPATNEVEQHGT